MKSKKLTISAVFLLLGLGGLHAQEATTASGGDALGSGGTVAYSVGQVAYTSIHGTIGSCAPGVQQTYEISVISGIEDETTINISLSVYPNPTADNLTLQVKDFNGKKLNYQLFDIEGKLWKTQPLTANQTQINMSSLLSGLYFIHVTHENQIVKSFRVIKN
jgi:hypothetical protein